MPRVRITYEARGGDGQLTAKELPFVVGVLGDFIGNGPTKPLRDTQFIAIDRDNFDVVMRRLAPALNLRVPNELSVGGEMTIRVAFESLEDFEPARIVAQVEPLRKLRAARFRLTRLAQVVPLEQG